MFVARLATRFLDGLWATGYKNDPGAFGAWVTMYLHVARFDKQRAKLDWLIDQ
jgi:hypothetical protein